jgi:hypothetical protein
LSFKIIFYTILFILNFFKIISVLPEPIITLSKEYRVAQLKRMIALDMQGVSGIPIPK